MTGLYVGYPGGPKPGEVFAALDMGSSKVTCLIARREARDPGKFTLLGGGRQQAIGFEAGAITDMDALSTAISTAVDEAESQAGERIDRVILGVTGLSLQCLWIEASHPMKGRSVTKRDIRRVNAAALNQAKQADYELLTAHPITYQLDEQTGIEDPEGQYAQTLSVRMSFVRAPEAFLLNLVECLGRAHLEIAKFVPTPIASAMGSLIDDELTNGAICIDCGAGMTSAAVFLNGAPAWFSILPIGGLHVTRDIAQGIGTTFAAAERLKTIHGHVNNKAAGKGDLMECPRLGPDGHLQSAQMRKGDLATIIAPRIEEIFELVAERLQAGAVKAILPHRGVLTGGASQLPGSLDLASQLLGLKLRLGQPVAAARMGETYMSPAYTTAAGLLSYGLSLLDEKSSENKTQFFSAMSQKSGRLAKIYAWMRENL